MRQFAPVQQAAPAPASPAQRVGKGLVQASLRLNTPGDAWERQADRLSEQVVAGPEAAAAGTPLAVQPAAPGGTGVAPPLVDTVLSRSGHALDAGTRAYFEPRFGHDFSRIRIHTDSVAAASTDAVDAHAYTAGAHIVFGRGTFQPGTTSGRRLLAHELVHTLQQGHAATPVGLQRIPKNPVGTPFPARVVLSYTSLRQAPADGAKVIAELDVFHSVTVRGGGEYIEVETLVKGVKTRGFIHHNLLERPDQRTRTRVPDADQQKKIGAELDPGAFAPAPPPPQPAQGPPPPAAPPVRVVWDGHTGQPNYRANRTALRTRLRTGLKAFLAANKAHVAKQKALQRIAMQKAGTGALAGKDVGVQGIAGAASDVLEGRYGSVMNAAVRTPSQEIARKAPMSAAPGARGQNLFDAYSKAERKRATGIASDRELAFGVAWWALQHDSNCSPHLQAHHLTPGWHPSPATEEWTFTERLLNQFVAQGSNRAELVDYRLFIWNETTDKGILLLTTFDPAAHRGNAARAEKTRRWSIFSTAIHETVHFRTHPAFKKADKGRGTMVEGFTEMFAKDAADPAFTRIRAGRDEPLRTAVEGAVAPIDKTVIPVSRTVSGKYLPAWNHAKAVRKEVRENAVRAAFFQGHVELLGLDPGGADLTGLRAAGARFKITKPPGVGNLAELARASGLSVAEIKAANTGITDALPAQIDLPGCREHVVVATTDRSRRTAVEERKHIAAQHGVDESALIRANPGIVADPATKAWPPLVQGQKILIPRH
jgi:hypothetical protein